jgi:hypothetical protein
MHSLVDPLKHTMGRALWLATSTVLLATHATHFNAIATEIPGDLDISFAGGHGASPSLTVSIGGINYLTAMALQFDGKMVLAGYCDGLNSEDFCVTRLHINGTLVAL